jgi:hypothetical protein
VKKLKAKVVMMFFKLKRILETQKIIVSRMLACMILWGSFLASVNPLHAQQSFESWAAGKKGAIYLSRKNFSYTQDWLQYLNQFTRLGGEDIPREDLKLATLVRLGQLLSRELNQQIPDLSILFLNEDPQLSSSWLSVLNTPNGQAPSPIVGLDTFDFILTVESLSLYANQEKSVYSVSNQIRTEKRLVYNLEAMIRITDGANHLKTATVPLRIMTDQIVGLKPRFDFDNASSPGGVLLAELFSKVLGVEMR